MSETIDTAPPAKKPEQQFTRTITFPDGGVRVTPLGRVGGMYSAECSQEFKETHQGEQVVKMNAKALGVPPPTPETAPTPSQNTQEIAAQLYRRYMIASIRRKADPSALEKLDNQALFDIICLDIDQVRSFDSWVEMVLPKKQ
jgi:hypothetical protein